MPYKVTGAPAVEPIDLAEAKEHLRQPLSDDDSLITSLIVAARQYAEKYTRRAFITQTVECKIDYFSDVIKLPLPPLQSVASIKYIDPDGVLQTLNPSVYLVDTDSTPGRITRDYGESWPETKPVPNAITITFVAGYGNAGTDVPDTIKLALKLYLTKQYDMDKNELEYLNNGINSNLDLERYWSV